MTLLVADPGGEVPLATSQENSGVVNDGASSSIAVNSINTANVINNPNYPFTDGQGDGSLITPCPISYKEIASEETTGGNNTVGGRRGGYGVFGLKRTRWHCIGCS